MLVSWSVTLHSAFLPTSGIYTVLSSDPGCAAGFSLRCYTASEQRISWKNAPLRSSKDQKTWLTLTQRRGKCCSEAHWGSVLRGKSENYTATSSGITCWLAPQCDTWINLIYLIKLYSDERLHSARPHTLCNRGYIKTVNQQHNNWMSVARVCVWFSSISSSVGVFVWYLFAGSMKFFEGDQNLYTRIRLRTVNREGFWRRSKRKAEQIMKLTMDEFHLAVSVSHCHCWLLHRAIFIITCQNVCGGKDWCIIAQCILSLF